MPNLQLDDVPADVFESLTRLAATHQSTVQQEALDILRRGVPLAAAPAPQLEVLKQLTSLQFAPAAETPDTVELLREDRQR